MKPVIVVTHYTPALFLEKTLLSLTKLSLIEGVVIVTQEPVHPKIPKCSVLVAGPIHSYETLSQILGGIRTKYLLLLPGPQQISVEPETLERFLEKAESTKAGLVYSDYYEESKRGKVHHTLCDYQLGSVRDDFDFGAMMLFSVTAIREALKNTGQYTTLDLLASTIFA